MISSELVQYVNRYFKKDGGTALKQFYTAHAVEGYRSNLPAVNDIEKFCERLVVAIKNNEKICIFSDYDTDAVTATGCMYWGLVYCGAKTENISYYAPDRFKESYGMNLPAVEKLCETNDLIITVDCGISSVDEAEYILNHKTTDLLITDHHALPKVLPKAVAVVNPQIEVEGKNKISKSTVGAGVAWFSVLYLAYYMAEKGLVESKVVKQMNKLLPLVAIGTIADCQSIIDSQNRMLVKAGLSMINNKQHGLNGLTELLRVFELLDYGVGSQGLGFLLSPALNAPGRIDHANESIDLILELKEPNNQARKVHKLNQKRKLMVREAADNLNDKDISVGNIVWLSGTWNKGIIGLIASFYLNQYDLPVVVATVDPKKPELAVGSMRAPEGYNFPAAMQTAAENFLKFGGHHQAAGFSADKSELDNIKKKLNKELGVQSKNIKKNEVVYNDVELPEAMQKYKYDKSVLYIESMNYKSLNQVWKLDPFGQDFPLPLMMFKSVLMEVKYMGGDKRTANIVTECGVKMIKFRMTDEQKNEITKAVNKELWFVAKPTKNNFRGNTKTELIAEEIFTQLS